MSKFVSLIALSPLLATGVALVTVTPAQAFNSYYCGPVCTTKYQSYSVPDPTRRGAFISHFNAAGAPQSLVTPSESDTVCDYVFNGNDQGD